MVNILPSYLGYYLEYDSEGEQQEKDRRSRRRTLIVDFCSGQLITCQ